MVVERQQIDAPVGQPLQDFSFGIEIEGLVAQMETGIGRKLRPQDSIASSNCLALSALRRPGSQDQVVPWNTVVMPLLIACRSLSITPHRSENRHRAGHHLPLERIAMQIDDARQHHRSAGIDPEC